MPDAAATTPLLLFDAAGTLIAPAHPVEDIYHRTFLRHGWETDPAAIRKSFRSTFSSLPDPDYPAHPDGDAAERAWWRRVVDATATAAGIDPAAPAFAPCFRDLFHHYARGDAWTVFPEVPAILEELRATGARMAVVSNFDLRLHQVLDELRLTRHFDLILTSACVRARKPSPLLLRAALSHFHTPPALARLVGDSGTADGGAARAAGIPAYILDRPATTLDDFTRWLQADNFLRK